MTGLAVLYCFGMVLAWLLSLFRLVLENRWRRSLEGRLVALEGYGTVWT